MLLHKTTLRTLSAAMALLLALLAAPSLPAIEVTTTADENGGSVATCALREAVRAINDESSFGGCTFTPGDTLIELVPVGIFTDGFETGDTSRWSAVTSG